MKLSEAKIPYGVLRLSPDDKCKYVGPDQYSFERVLIPPDVDRLHFKIASCTDLQVDSGHDTAMLRSMQGFPVRIHGNCSIREYEYIKSFDGELSIVDESLEIAHSGLHTLVGIPRVGANIWLYGNLITNLTGIQRQVAGDFHVSSNPLTSLANGPVDVSGDYSASSTAITSVEHIAMNIGGGCYLDDTRIRSLANIHKTHAAWKIGKALVIDNTISNILGLALIPGIESVMFGKQWFDISNNDPFEFQEALLEAGFPNAARL